MQEQHKCCDACQNAMADKQHAEVIRLLRTQQMGMHIRDEKMAWQLLKVSRAGNSYQSCRVLPVLAQHSLRL